MADPQRRCRSAIAAEAPGPVRLAAATNGEYQRRDVQDETDQLAMFEPTNIALRDRRGPFQGGIQRYDHFGAEVPETDDKKMRPIRGDNAEDGGALTCKTAPWTKKSPSKAMMTTPTDKGGDQR